MNLLKIINRVLYFLLLFSGIIYSREKVVAKVGNINITEPEFKERFDFSVHPGLIQESGRQAEKHKFLEQLIAEKLLSLDAQNKKYDTMEVYKNFITPLENIYTRDALYNREVKQKVSYTAEELEEGIQRIKKIYKVKFIYSINPEELQNAYSVLKAGASFDSLLALRKESSDQKDLKSVTFGTMEKEIEDSLYRLKAGEFTGPLQSGDGFYILKAVSIENNPDTRGADMIIDDVKRIVQARSEHKEYLQFYREFFSRQKATADKDIFAKLALILANKIKIKYAHSDSSAENNKFNLRGYEVGSALDFFNPEIRNGAFIKIPGKPSSLKYFINQLSCEGFFVQNLSDFSIKSSLSSYIRKFIEDELLAMDGKNKKLNESDEVKKYTGMWKDSFLSKMVMMNFFDSLKVSEKEAYELYKQDKGGNFQLESVNIVEVLTDSLPTVEKILNEIAKGKDIRELARLYTKRDSLKNKGGESGFFPITKHGELGRIASQMKVGDVYGPLKLDEGYSVFQLIDRRVDTTYIQDFDTMKDQIMLNLTLEKFEDCVNKYNAKLAVKYGVEIDEEALNQVDDIFMNLVVVRYMGFGEEIFAVPYTEQFDGWYKLWVENKNVNP